ncbi:MAG: glucose-6-phosphate dehydrogenase, partial [Nitrospiraceae bacterium]
MGQAIYSPAPVPFTDSGRGQPVEPCTLVIFGASGDLTRRKLIPALYNLLLDGMLPSNFAVLGTGRKTMSHEDFRVYMKEGVLRHSRRPLQEDRWTEFAPRLFYHAGDVEDPNAYEALKASLKTIESSLNLPGHRIYYLAVPPDAFIPVCKGLQHVGVVYPPGCSFPFCRL